jgi:hypothetical protein
MEQVFVGPSRCSVDGHVGSSIYVFGGEGFQNKEPASFRAGLGASGLWRVEVWLEASAGMPLLCSLDQFCVVYYKHGAPSGAFGVGVCPTENRRTRWTRR